LYVLAFYCYYPHGPFMQGKLYNSTSLRYSSRSTVYLSHVLFVRILCSRCHFALLLCLKPVADFLHHDKILEGFRSVRLILPRRAFPLPLLHPNSGSKRSEPLKLRLPPFLTNPYQFPPIFRMIIRHLNPQTMLIFGHQARYEEKLMLRFPPHSTNS